MVLKQDHRVISLDSLNKLKTTVNPAVFGGRDKSNTGTTLGYNFLWNIELEIPSPVFPHPVQAPQSKPSSTSLQCWYIPLMLNNCLADVPLQHKSYTVN